mmetsp:Transcript_16/g.38  ORF Transcript_16/g.38 Transcript_16/m.38 type:complete len:104 (-) Transcript_16:747-1058(-)
MRLLFPAAHLPPSYFLHLIACVLVLLRTLDKSCDGVGPAHACRRVAIASRWASKGIVITGEFAQDWEQDASLLPPASNRRGTVPRPAKRVRAVLPRGESELRL